MIAFQGLTLNYSQEPKPPDEEDRWSRDLLAVHVDRTDNAASHHLVSNVKN